MGKVFVTEEVLQELKEAVDYIQYENGVSIYLQNSYVNFSPQARTLLKELDFEFVHPFLLRGTLFSGFYAFPYHVKPFVPSHFLKQHPHLQPKIAQELPHLYSFQREAVLKALTNFYNGLPFFGLFWDVGVGKTVTSLTIAKKLQEKHQLPVLVLAPKPLLYQWAEEARKFSLFEDIHIMDKRRDWERHDLMLATYEGFRIDAKKYPAEFWKDFIVILDEASRIKNASAKLTRTIISSFKNTFYKMALTATPYETSSLNVYNILRFLSPYIISAELYLRAFSHTTTLTRIKLKNTLMLRQFLNLIGDFKQKHEVKNLPKLTVKDVQVSHTTSQKRLAILLAQRTSSFFAIHNLLKMVDNSLEDLEQSSSPLLEQLVPEFSHILSTYKRHTEKDEVLESFIDEIYPRQVIIFTQFKRTAHRISRLLSTKHHQVIDGSTPNKHTIINSFKQKQFPILITTDTLAYGVSFPEVNYLVNYDILYNPAKVHQRIGRIYRINSTQPKYVLNIIGGGIEKHTHAILKERWKDMNQLISSDVWVDALSSYLSDLLNQPPDNIKQKLLQELGKESI